MRRLSSLLLLLAVAGCGGRLEALTSADMASGSSVAVDFALGPMDLSVARDLPATGDLPISPDLAASGDLGAGAPCDPSFDACQLKGFLACDAVTRVCVTPKPCTVDGECGNYRCGNVVQNMLTCFVSCPFGPACVAPAVCDPKTLICAF